MSAFPITSQSELHSLIPLVPSLLSWLREINPATAADVFKKINSAMFPKQDLIVNFAFRGLLAEREKHPKGLSTTQLKLIFASYDIQVNRFRLDLTLIRHE